MYIMDDFKQHPEYVKLLYIEATSAGSVCTMARAMASNIRAYMSDSEIHPSVLLTLRSLENMISMRDDWLNRLRDMQLADRAPLPFDETIGATVPADTQRRAIETTKAIAQATKDTSDSGDVNEIFTRAFTALGEDVAFTPAPAKPKRKRRAKADAAD